MKTSLVKLKFILPLIFSISLAHAADPTTVNTLTNEVTTPTPNVEKSSLTTADDEKILSTIKSEIEANAVLSKLNVNVAVHQGVVTFSGQVNSDSEASSLIETAQSVVGVTDVEANDLKIEKSTQPFKDMMITAKIKGLFIRDDIFGTKDIASINLSVETKNGVVYLTGVIDNPEQLENARKIIKTVSGVTKVEYIVKKVTVNQ